MTPMTDFNEFFPEKGDIPSEIDAFNDDNMAHQIKEREDYIKKQLNAFEKVCEEAEEAKAEKLAKLDNGQLPID